MVCCWSGCYYERHGPLGRYCSRCLKMCCVRAPGQSSRQRMWLRWIWDSLSLVACQVDCSLLQHIHTHDAHKLALWCIIVWLLANRYSDKTRSHTLQGQTGGGRACKPLIRSTQIWYHYNQISDDAEYTVVYQVLARAQSHLWQWSDMEHLSQMQ